MKTLNKEISSFIWKIGDNMMKESCNKYNSDLIIKIIDRIMDKIYDKGHIDEMKNE